MQLKKGIFAALLSILFVSIPAQAVVGMSIVGGGVKEHDGDGWGPGAGGLIDFHQAGRLSFESGALIFSNKLAGPDTVTSIYVPATFNIHFHHFTFYAGGYYNDFLKRGYSADYGWKAGIRFGQHRFFVDGSYSAGLKDQGGGFQYSYLMGLLGYRFGLL
jgi:hypothetical protein